MPVGVQSTITTPPSAGGSPVGDVRTYMVAGMTERGDTTAPIISRSFSEFIDLTGKRVTYGSVYDDAATFFGEAAAAGVPARHILMRGVGSAATKGFLNLADGSSVATLKVAAKDEGAWSAGLTVQVTAGILTNTFNLLIGYPGSSGERYLNLASPAAAVAALVNSSYVRGTDLGSVTAAPGNNPAVMGPTALPAGSDDRGSVDAPRLIATLNKITSDYGPGLVAIPGQPYSTVAAGIAAHIAATGRDGLTAAALGTSVTSAKAAAATLRATTGAERLGFIYPGVTIPDGNGGNRLISPEGYAAGRRAVAIDRFGPWRAPAGVLGQAQYATGVEFALTADEINSLDDSAVSCIRLTSSGPRLYGWRSLSADLTNYSSLTTSDLLNDLAYRMGGALEQYLFQPVDGEGRFLTHVANDLRAILNPIADAGGLYVNANGNPPDPGYKIDVGPTVNTPTTLARGEVHAQVEVRDSPTAQFIRIFLTKVALTSEL